MKKFLTASTALMASTNIASADIALTGTASAGVRYFSSLSPTYEVVEQTEFRITGSGTTDSGFTFGASLDLTSGYKNYDTWNSTRYDRNRSLVYISSAFGTLSFGDVSNAGDVGGITHLGFQADGPATVNWRTHNWRGFHSNYQFYREFLRDASQGHEVHFETTFGDVTLTASGTINQPAGKRAFGAGLVYESGGYYVALGHSSDQLSEEYIDTDTSQITLGGTFDDFAVKVFYASSVRDSRAHSTAAFELDYSIGATTLTLQIVGSDHVEEEGELGPPAYAVGFAHDLGGGASLKGVLAKNNYAYPPGSSPEIIADLGVTMRF